MDLLDPQMQGLVGLLLQILVIPVVYVLWGHNRRIAAHDTEVVRILTILQTREENRLSEKLAEQQSRDRERQEDREVIRELKASIDKLNQRLDHIPINRSPPKGDAS